MREILTYGSVGGLVEQSPILPGQATANSLRSCVAPAIGGA
jgi:hypothetical protein